MSEDFKVKGYFFPAVVSQPTAIMIKSKNKSAQEITLLKSGNNQISLDFGDNILCTMGKVRCVLDFIGQNLAGNIELNSTPQHSESREILIDESLIAELKNRQAVKNKWNGGGNIQAPGGRVDMDSMSGFKR